MERLEHAFGRDIRGAGLSHHGPCRFRTMLLQQPLDEPLKISLDLAPGLEVNHLFLQMSTSS